MPESNNSNVMRITIVSLFLSLFILHQVVFAPTDTRALSLTATNANTSADLSQTPSGIKQNEKNKMGVVTSPTHSSAAQSQAARAVKMKFQLRQRTLEFHTYFPRVGRENVPLVFFSSGSGGWHNFDGHIAENLAARGVPVVGISTHSYLNAFYSGKKPATPQSIGADYREMIAEARRVAKVSADRPVLLAGWSLGAGYSVLAASRPEMKDQVAGVISISVSRDNELSYNAFHRLMSHLTNKVYGARFNVVDFLRKTDHVPVAIIQSTGDDSASPTHAETLLREARPEGGRAVRLFAVKTARNHSFKGGREEFNSVLGDALTWISEHNSSDAARTVVQ